MSIMTPAMTDILCTVFQEELAHGKENWPNGTNPSYYGREAERQLDAMTAAALAKRVTFSHFLLSGAFVTLASRDETELRQNLIDLTSQLVIWLEALDRRKAGLAA